MFTYTRLDAFVLDKDKEDVVDVLLRRPTAKVQPLMTAPQTRMRTFNLLSTQRNRSIYLTGTNRPN